jgi:endogenous inhibitor of DNA gyrase (YacG/DUF329 family)
MRSLRLARKFDGELAVDLCADCQALWFDTLESVQLAPGATLALFDAIRTARPEARRALPATLPCPRCTLPLALTQDLQHTTRFSYYRCTRGHGRFTPFVQFLREKDFIRPLAPAELARLRATIRTVGCSSCGAPVDLEHDSACPYCRTPIAILDPDALTATVGALESAEARRTSVDVDALVDGMLEAQRHAAEFAREETPGGSGARAAVDLVALGLAAIGTLLGR